MGDWAIVWLINGWTEGSGYNNPEGSVICDKGMRTENIGECLMVNKDYPCIYQGLTMKNE